MAGTDTHLSRARTAVLGGAWLAVGVFLCVDLVWFATQFHVTTRRPLAIVGEVIAAIVVVGWIAVSRRLRREQIRRGPDALVLATETRNEEAVAESDQLAGVRDAHLTATRALAHFAYLGDEAVLRSVLLVRVGHNGVDLLLAEALEHALVGTELVEDGRVVHLE